MADAPNTDARAILNLPPDQREEAVQKLLVRLSQNTNEMYAAKREVERLKSGDYSKDLARAFEIMEQHGLMGDTQWYCAHCRFAVKAKQNFMGAGWLCCSCQRPVVKIAELNPVELKNETVDAEEKAQAAKRELMAAKIEHESLVKRLRRRIKFLKKYGTFKLKDKAQREASRADRSIKL